ncbi:MAG TPA: uracil-DNA glycosylase [Candidatus Acidoferrales bacterium]|nr:uracil-DNA glycosylase [Candidatus Acidoferrales bacterium]
MPRDRTPPTAPAQVTLQTLLDQLRASVEYQQSASVEGFPLRTDAVRPERMHETPAPAAPIAPSPPQAVASVAEPPTVLKAAAASGDLFTTPGTRQAGTLADLRTEIGDCRRCKLWPGRTHIVFGVGNPQAQLMFVGEGPGRDEDLQGEPFVGRAGQLLTEIITKGMKLRREDVYIANVVKCRPPENRNPEPDEIAACQPFLLRQVELVQPKVLVALGTFAAQTLLGLRVPISRLRGHWYDYHGIKLMPTLHPAYLLRNPNDKRLVWEDIKLVLRELA